MSENTETTNDATTDATETGAATALAAAAGGDEPQADASAETEVADDDASTDDAPGLIGAPDDYDTTAFTMPEGVEFDAEMFELVKDDLKGMDLSQEGASKVVGLFAEKVVPKIAERTTAQIEQQGQEISAQLARDLQADPIVGGTKLKESQAFAAKAIAAAIPEATERSEFSKFLNESGLGNHPLLMRVIAAGGRALGEATTPLGETATERSTVQKFYNRS